MLTIQNTGLVVVDIQGNLAHMVHQSDVLIRNALAMIKGAKALQLPIIHLEQAPQKLGSTVTELADELKPYNAIIKHTFNACDVAEFPLALKAAKRDHWLICGIEAHICVYQSAMGMMDLGYTLEVVCDAISARKEENKILAINKLSANGASITSVEMILYELVGDSRSAAFKAILPLIK